MLVISLRDWVYRTTTKNHGLTDTWDTEWPFFIYRFCRHHNGHYTKPDDKMGRIKNVTNTSSRCPLYRPTAVGLHLTAHPCQSIHHERIAGAQKTREWKTWHRGQQGWNNETCYRKLSCCPAFCFYRAMLRRRRARLCHSMTSSVSLSIRLFVCL